MVWSFLLFTSTACDNKKAAKTRKRAAESMGGGYVPPHLRASDAAESTSLSNGSGTLNNNDSGGDEDANGTFLSIA